jgi:hypothetical protein
MWRWADIQEGEERRPTCGWNSYIFFGDELIGSERLKNFQREVGQLNPKKSWQRRLN